MQVSRRRTGRRPEGTTEPAFDTRRRSYHEAPRSPSITEQRRRISGRPGLVAALIFRVYRLTGLMKRVSVTGVLLAAFVVQVALAAPAHAMAGLRAVTCCARGCGHARSLTDAMRCCGVRIGDDLAVTPHAGKSVVLTFVAHAPCASASVFGDALVAYSTHQTPPRDRPPPIFLLVRSLRL